LTQLRDEIFIWRLHQGSTSHHALGFSYTTNVMDTTEPGKRNFKVEIMYNNEEVMLIFTGPECDFTHYTKDKKICLSGSMLEVKQCCTETFREFGDYKTLTNNCQHFVIKCIDKLEKELNVKKLTIEEKEEYFESNNYLITVHGRVSNQLQPDNHIENLLSNGTKDIKQT